MLPGGIRHSKTMCPGAAGKLQQEPAGKRSDADRYVPVYRFELPGTEAVCVRQIILLYKVKLIKNDVKRERNV